MLRDAAARAVDVEADPLGPVLVLEEEELHDRQVGDGVVDHAFEKDDAILEEQVAQGHLPLPRVVAVALEQRIGERRFKNGMGRSLKIKCQSRLGFRLAATGSLEGVVDRLDVLFAARFVVSNVFDHRRLRGCDR